MHFHLFSDARHERLFLFLLLFWRVILCHGHRSLSIINWTQFIQEQWEGNTHLVLRFTRNRQFINLFICFFLFLFLLFRPTTFRVIIWNDKEKNSQIRSIEKEKFVTRIFFLPREKKEFWLIDKNAKKLPNALKIGTKPNEKKNVHKFNGYWSLKTNI